MGRARIGLILATLWPALAGLLLIAVLFGGATTQPAAAAERPAAGSAQGAAVLSDTIAATLPMRPEIPTSRGLTASAAAVDGTIRGQQPQAAASPLEGRLQQWPIWKLPAPLVRPGRQAPLWPAWFSGEWQVESVALPLDPNQAPRPDPPWRARFRADGHGGAVAERACNALSVGRSLLGGRLLSVQDDPANPQRQLARLAGDALLETTLIGLRSEHPGPDSFLNDELSLQVLHAGTAPRVSRIETLGRWRLQADGSIAAEQWQARYGSPADGLAAAALASEHWRLRLVPVPPGSDPATGTAATAADCR